MAHVVQQAVHPVGRLTGLHFGQAGLEGRGPDQNRGLFVVRVPVFGVGQQQQAGPQLPDRLDHRPAVFRAGPQAAVGELEIDPALDAQHSRRGVCFGPPGLLGPAAGEFALGEIDDGGPVSQADQPGHRTAAEKFHVIGVRAESRGMEGPSEGVSSPGHPFSCLRRGLQRKATMRCLPEHGSTTSSRSSSSSVPWRQMKGRPDSVRSCGFPSGGACSAFVPGSRRLCGRVAAGRT